VGQHCLFVRLTNCNLECTWCDTAFTWAFSEAKARKTQSGKQYKKGENLKVMTTDEVRDALRKLWPIDTDPTNIIISGGEPLMQSKDLEELARELAADGHEVHIETAGTLMPTYSLNGVVHQYNVSPKLEHSGNVLSKRYKPDVLQWFGTSNKAWFKFVMREAADFIEIDKIVEECKIPKWRVMVMPEGVTAEDNIRIARAIEADAKDRGYGLSLRQHILLWSDVRGK
jgi:organic radical activating enzyme